MENDLEINNQKDLEKVAENLGGVSFSGGQELHNAVSDVAPSKTGIFAKIKRFFSKGSNSSQHNNA